MSTVTISTPALGLQAYFSFKEPVLSYVRNKLNTSDSAILLKVIGINNLKALLESELRDPFIDAYNPIGISSQEYKRDVLDDIPLYVFAHTALSGKVTYVKCPLSYISDYSLTTDMLYTNKLVVIDLQRLPQGLDTVSLFPDLSDLVYSKLGVLPAIKEVSIGNPEKITREEYELRESMRLQGVSVNKCNATLLAEMTHKYNQLVARLSAINISLG